MTASEYTPNMLLATVAPTAAERMQRLDFALRQLRAGLPPLRVRRLLRELYGVSYPTAWRIVCQALDMASDAPHAAP